MVTTSSTHEYSRRLSDQLQLPRTKIDGTLELLEEGGTVPFIARYRKEATGSLDEVAISAIYEGYQKLLELDKRRTAILEGLSKNHQLTSDLKTKLQKAESLTVLEDLYLPFRPKRRTRAQRARQQGLEPLARIVRENRSTAVDLSRFLKADQGVTTKEEAFSGARDIIAEEIAEEASTRSTLRELFRTQAIIESRVVKKNEHLGEKFTDYFNWQEPASKAAGHRILALLRGQSEKVLKLSVRPPQESGFRLLKKIHLTSGPWQQELSQAIEDSYSRLLAPSLETELVHELKAHADDEAIQVFGDNLRQLLLSAPLGAKRVLAIDPGYRTGGKVVCLDGQGALLANTTIYPTHGSKQQKEAAHTIQELVARYHIEAIAIGNGTAGRETESFIRDIQLSPTPIITLVNEDGASIYSASEVARTEFPDHDITVRGAVSIGRRLQDPMAELVKIDPKSIGVGQYQHDVNQTQLKSALGLIIESCVNSVGVELNNASVELLSHVAGLSSSLATNIVKHRNQITSFRSRKELLDVPRLGPKAYEQCAGFLRIRHGSNPLDDSAVHPERYSLVNRMARDCNVSIAQLLDSTEVQRKIVVDNYIDKTTGRETIEDILAELAKPGRDPREEFEQFRFSDNIRDMNDLQEGMQLPAIVTNITRFGAFVDVGIKIDGLIHISQLADRFVKDPSDIVHLGQKLTVRVLDVDHSRKRIALTLKGL